MLARAHNAAVIMPKRVGAWIGASQNYTKWHGGRDATVRCFVSGLSKVVRLGRGRRRR